MKEEIDFRPTFTQTQLSFKSDLFWTERLTSCISRILVFLWLAFGRWGLWLGRVLRRSVVASCPTLTPCWFDLFLSLRLNWWDNLTFCGLGWMYAWTKLLWSNMNLLVFSVPFFLPVRSHWIRNPNHYTDLVMTSTGENCFSSINFLLISVWVLARPYPDSFSWVGGRRCFW